MRSIIYITNTQLPSQKANAYQSLCMCEAFALKGVEVALWHPVRKGDYADSHGECRQDIVKTIYEPNNIANVFQLKRLFSIDSPWLKHRSKKLWFYVQSFSFWFACIIALQKENPQSTVFIRDTTALAAFSTVKKIGLLRQKLIFEAHRYSKSIAKYIGTADYRIVISHQLKKLYDFDDSKKILVAHDAVRGEELLTDNQLSDSSNKLALSLRTRKVERIILYVGNLFRWKGVYTLVDCMQYLPEHYRIVIVGGSEDTLPEFRRYAAKIKGVEVIGFKPRNEIRSYLLTADVLILPNSANHAISHVTSPLKLFEYMSARKPIVASRLPSVQEILQDGKNAKLFTPDDAEDLAEKINWVLSNDCSDLVNQAWENVREHTWDRRAGKIIAWTSD
ncbi:MAG: glycosyltransferase family 4 protein [Cyanobacteria bacterium J06560_6]